MTVTPGIACGYWNARKRPRCARSSASSSVTSSPSRRIWPSRDLVGGMAHERVGERRLAGAVRAHDRVHLVRVHGEVDALDDLGAVLERDVQVLQFQQCHFVRSESFFFRRNTGFFVPPMVARTVAELPTCALPQFRRDPGAPRAKRRVLGSGHALRIGCGDRDPPPRRPARLRAKRLPEIGRSLGRGMREFKDSITGKDDDDDTMDAPRRASSHAPDGRGRASRPPRERDSVVLARLRSCAWKRLPRRLGHGEEATLVEHLGELRPGSSSARSRSASASPSPSPSTTT